MTTLSVLIGGDDRELQAALRRAQSGLRKLGGEVRDGISSFAMWGAAAAAAGTTAAAYFVKQAMEAVDAQAKLANALNTTVASMATLERAANLDGVSTQQLETAVRKLSTTLGEAANGTGTAVESLKRLHLAARDLASLPVDQRMALINERIKEHIPLAEQAAVSADFFGERAGLAMLNLSPETIQLATDQTRLFGHALSDIDAAKVEEAGDSFSRIGYAADGLWKQMAVKLAPVITRIGDEFERAVEEAGGMEVVATRSFNKVVAAAGFVADSVDGIRRVAVITADGIIIAMAAAESAMRRVLAIQLKVAQIGIVGMFGNFKKLGEDNRQAMSEAEGVVREAWDNIQQTLEEPLPSEGFKKFVADAEVAAEAAAAVVVAGRAGAREGAPPEEDQKVDKAAEQRLERLRQQFMDEEELQFQQWEKQREDIAKFEEQKLIGEEEAQAMREESEMLHWERVAEIRQRAADKQIAIEEAKNRALQQAQSNFFSNLSGLMNTESKKVFEIGKTAAIVQAVIKTKQAVVDAWQAGMSTGGPWAPAVAAAYAGAAALNGANLINNIRSQQFGGGGGTPIAPTQGSSNVSPQGAGGGSTAGGGSSAQQTAIIQLQGEVFGRQTVIGLIDQINDALADGARLRVA